MTDSTKASERLHHKRFSDESDVAFVTMLRVAANNLCDEQLWKDLCNEAADRLEQESKPCTCKERINSFCDACIEHIMKEDSARTTPQTQGVMGEDDWNKQVEAVWAAIKPHLGLDFNYNTNKVLIADAAISALAKNTPPLNGGIGQHDEASASSIIDSTSRESLPNSCERCVPYSDAQVRALVEALEACKELFSVIRSDWTDPRSECRAGQAIIANALAPFKGAV